MHRTVSRRHPSGRVAPGVGGLLALALLIAAPSTTQAQSPMQQVLDLNRQAMEAYMMLELEQAQQLLQQALQLAQSNNVTGTALARTHLNLGVIAVGGFADNGGGMSHFENALRADGSIQLDPLQSTPEIQQVFALAQRRVGSGGGSGGGSTGGGSTGGGSTGGGSTGGGAGAVSGNLPHMPVPEQLAQTAVPVYIEVANDPAHVYLFYKAHGMRDYQRVEMQSVAGGYGFEIPCTDVFQPSIDYYIVAFDAEGGPMGFAGSQQDPVNVPIVSSRTQPAPALPGRAPPEQCADTECPPGMESCGGGGGMGSTCRSDSDCGDGLSCEDDLCVSGGDGGDDQGEPPLPRFFFVRAGLGGAFGYVQAGMQADTCPPNIEPDRRNPASANYDPELAAACGEPPFAALEDSYVEGGTLDCGLDPGQYCVRVAQPGFVPSLQIRLAAGGYFVPWVGAAAFARFAPFSGHGDLAFALFGLRLQVRPLGEELLGGIVSPMIFAGFSVGQVQHQPPGNGENAPYVISGLNGVPIGFSIDFQIARMFGFYVEAEAMFQFPTFMFNLDASVGVQVGY